ncbi:Vacuolar protein sorting-associated protein 70 [Marasmius crinis-equi]|uniref:Vacuolar protein sorting-associated protein 70 n=1 Tax=Marasmius crinis-equi TaxID=585013 RepID=A0ABR3FM09_9AGAR
MSSLAGKDNPEKSESPLLIPPPTTATLNNRRNKPRRVLWFFVKLSLALALGVHLASYWYGEESYGGGGGSMRPPRKGHGHRRPRYLPPKVAEKEFLKVPDNKSALEASRHYAGKPHLAGSEQDFEQAKDFLAFLQKTLDIDPPKDQPIFSAGSPDSQHATLSIPKLKKPQAWIDVYYPILNTPLEHGLQALDKDGNVVWEADLEEHPDKTDPDAHKYADAVTTFHGLSANGDVKGQLVYANYGLKTDYDDLVSNGVNLTGKIVLARYGGNFRGLKIKGAEELGAAGVLIFSDPKDDGTVTVENGYKPYPHGPARNADSVQRGSVQYLSLYPGDPTTPGYPSYENSTRTDGENIPTIPSLPISWANAKKLLDLLDGKDAGAKEWSGDVRLFNKVDTKVTPIWNTIGVIPGWIKDEIVVLGNHRDAWVLGAADPTSGTASIHETIRGLGKLLKLGWKPLRTIVFASWDAEEYGLIGSTEWGEDFAKFISKHVVAYLNLDGSASGSHFSAQASPLIAHVVRHAADDLPHPTRKKATLWDATNDQGELLGDHVDSEALSVREIETSAADTLGVGVLGSGSDYTVFLQRLGVPSMNHGFGAGTHDPVYHYHSIYDSQRFQEKYADPGFHRHVVVAKHLGLIALRIAQPPILPFNTTHYAYELDNYLDSVEELVTTNEIQVDLSPLRKSIGALQASSLALDYEKLAAQRELVKVLRQLRKHRRETWKLKKRIRRAYCRWQKKVFGKECRKHHKHEEDEHEGADDTLAEISSGFGIMSLSRIYASEEAGYDKREQMDYGWAFAIAERLEQDVSSDEGCSRHHKRPRWPGWLIRRLIHAVKRVRAVNKKLIAFERGFISEEGIPEREWYRHLGVAPGKWLGYGATTLPALTESITFEKNATLAKHEVQRLKAVVDGIIETITVTL